MFTAKCRFQRDRAALGIAQHDHGIAVCAVTKRPNGTTETTVFLDEQQACALTAALIAAGCARRGGEKYTDSDTDKSSDIAAFERAVTVLRDAKDGEIETLKGALDEARGCAERAELALAAERSRGDALRDRLDGAEEARRQAQEAAEALRRAEGRAAGTGAATARLGWLARPLDAGGAARLTGGARRAVGGLYPARGDREAAEGETKSPAAPPAAQARRAGTFRTPPTSEGSQPLRGYVRT